VKSYEPKNPKNWYKVYYKLVREDERENEKSLEMLKEGMAKKKEERAALTTQLVPASSLPRDHIPAKLRNKRSGGSASKGNGLLSFNSGSRTSMQTGAGVIARARREAKEASLFSNKHSALSTPTHLLQNRATTVKKVAQGLDNSYHAPGRQEEWKKTPTIMRAPKAMPNGKKNTSAVSQSKPYSDREAKLRALTSGGKQPIKRQIRDLSESPETSPIRPASAESPLRDSHRIRAPHRPSSSQADIHRPPPAAELRYSQSSHVTSSQALPRSSQTKPHSPFQLSPKRAPALSNSPPPSHAPPKSQLQARGPPPPRRSGGTDDMFHKKKPRRPVSTSSLGSSSAAQQVAVADQLAKKRRLA
jgi:elongin-A